jgi:hypothetical protein
MVVVGGAKSRPKDICAEGHVRQTGDRVAYERSRTPSETELAKRD